MKEGTRKTSDGYQVNFDKEDIDDIISFDIRLYESTIKVHVYQFGTSLMTMLIQRLVLTLFNG